MCIAWLLVQGASCPRCSGGIEVWRARLRARILLSPVAGAPLPCILLCCSRTGEHTGPSFLSMAVVYACMQCLSLQEGQTAGEEPAESSGRDTFALHTTVLQPHR